MRGGGNMMKQAMALQANMKKAQEEIAAMEVIGESGGGMVKVTMNGKHEVKRVQIEPQVISEDREMLEDLIAAAINDAREQGRGRIAGAHVERDVGHQPAARLQAALLTSSQLDAARRTARPAHRRAARAAGRRARRPRSAWPSTCCRVGATVRARWPQALTDGSGDHPPLQALPHAHRHRVVFDLRGAGARCRVAVRGRVARRRRRGGAVRQLIAAATSCCTATCRRSTASARSRSARASSKRCSIRARCARSSSPPIRPSKARPPRISSASAPPSAKIQASRIAHGVPIGGELEYVDGGTLAHALAGRHRLSAEIAVTHASRAVRIVKDRRLRDAGPAASTRSEYRRRSRR